MNNLNTKQKLTIGVIFFIIILIIGFYIWKQSSSLDYSDLDDYNIMENSTTTDNAEPELSTDNSLIVIHITGCILNQGIIKVNEGSRIADAIDAAGGLTKDADMSKINLAYMIEDGQKIYVPSIYDISTVSENNPIAEEYVSSEPGDNVVIDSIPSTSSTTSKKDSTKTGLVNINTATQTELETLSGIGPSTASKIIEYRNSNGSFNSVEDIKNVSGIGDAKYENIKNNITF